MELARWFPKIMELLEEEVRLESEGWVAIAVVARSLGRRVVVDTMVRDYRL